MRNLEKDEIEMAARRELMLEKGFQIFAEKGIEGVSMLEIAKACGLGIATLYRYFNTKHALILAIGARKWEEYGAEIREKQKKSDILQMSAAEQLEFYLDSYIALYEEHKELLRFNQSFNNYVLHAQFPKEELLPYMDAINGLFDMFQDLYEKGREDGTIRTDLPVEKMFAATTHIMLAVAVRYAQGLVFSAEREEDRTEEFNLLKRALLREFVTA